MSLKALKSLNQQLNENTVS